MAVNLLRAWLGNTNPYLKKSCVSNSYEHEDTLSECSRDPLAEAVDGIIEANNFSAEEVENIRTAQYHSSTMAEFWKKLSELEGSSNEE